MYVQKTKNCIRNELYLIDYNSTYIYIYISILLCELMNFNELQERDSLI